MFATYWYSFLQLAPAILIFHCWELSWKIEAFYNIFKLVILSYHLIFITTWRQKHLKIIQMKQMRMITHSSLFKKKKQLRLTMSYIKNSYTSMSLLLKHLFWPLSLGTNVNINTWLEGKNIWPHKHPTSEKWYPFLNRLCCTWYYF